MRSLLERNIIAIVASRPIALRLVSPNTRPRAALARLRLIWRRRLLHLQDRRRRRHRAVMRAIVQAARTRRRTLSRLARDRERGQLGC